jgi:hypothetical protein
VVPVFILALTPVVTAFTRNDELKVTIRFTLIFAALVLAISAPIIFFYNLLPDRRR